MSTPAPDPFANLRIHIDGLTLPDLIKFHADLQSRVDAIQSSIPPDAGAVSSNAVISRIEMSLKLVKAVRQRRETQATPLPATTTAVITDTIALLDQIDKAP